MAITRAQQVRQMLRRGSNPNKQEGASEERTRDPRGDKGGFNFGQFERRQRQNEALKGTGFLGKDQGMNVGPQKNVLQRGIEAATKFSPVFNFLNALSTNRTNLKPVDLSMAQRDGRGGILPLWAQLGFNSEEEFQAAQRMSQAPSTMDQETEEEPEGLRLAFRADGGPIGGIMDIESGRQMYFLGKLVKKATRAVKKIAKSPIGKAALLYGLGAVGGSFGNTGKFFSSGMFNPGNIGRGLFGITAKGQALRGFPELAAKKGLLGQLGLTGGYGSLMPTALGGIAAASALAGLLTPKQEEEAELLATEEGIDIEAARRMILQAGTSADRRALAFRAEGGPAEGKEPVAKKTMPLLDMDGQEMDLREEGGFVPIGRMEKADDVPARLSKNEFVFTADAVRNAGNGNVDKGAEVMYNMMKNLEAGGDVSEESQGKEGARRMFQTSQRLEEVL
jgi:hypothetical protein